MAHKPGVEIFSIGTELVMGRIQDTNAFWMAQELVDLGAMMRRITVLPDDIDSILEAFEGAVQRHTDVVLTSGGLAAFQTISQCRPCPRWSGYSL